MINFLPSLKKLFALMIPTLLLKKCSLFCLQYSAGPGQASFARWSIGQYLLPFCRCTSLAINLALLTNAVRPRLNYAGEIWRRCVISTFRPTFHTSPSRKRSFSKTLFKPEEFENAGHKTQLKTETFDSRSNSGAFGQRIVLKTLRF